MGITLSSRAAKILVGVSVFLVAGLALSGLFGRTVGTSSRDPEAESLNLAIEVLEAGLTSADPRLQRLAFNTLTEYYCQQDRKAEECAQIISRAVAHAHWQVRLTNLPIALRSEIPEQLRRRVVKQAVQDSTPHIRRAVSKLLSGHPEEWEKELLTELVESPDIVMQEHAAAALIRLGEKQYITVLEKGLRSGDPDAALEAAQHVIALKLKGQAQAERLLKAMLEDSDEIIRANTIYALSELAEFSWDGRVIERLVADDSPMVRLAMVSALPLIHLPERDMPGAFELLVKLWSKEKRLDRRMEILNAVNQLDSIGAVSSDSVMRFAQEVVQGERDKYVRLAAMGILALHGQSQYARHLLAVAQDSKRDFSERIVSLSSLSRCRDRSIIGPLTRLMEGQDEKAGGAQAIRMNSAVAIIQLVTVRPAGEGL